MHRLGRLIEQRMDQTGWSLNAIARRGGMARQTLSNLMAKPELKQTPRPATLVGLAKGLELPLDMIKEAAAESAGFRVHDVSQHDEKGLTLLVASAEQLTPKQIAALTQLAESMLKDDT